MTTTRTPAHPEQPAAGGRVEGPQAFRRRPFPLVLSLSKYERSNHAPQCHLE